MANQTWPKRFGRAAELVEEGGLEHLMVRALEKLASPAVGMGSLIFFRRDIREPMPRGKPIREIELRIASLQDVPLLSGNDPKAEIALRLRLERGDICCVGVDGGGRLAHFRWVSLCPTYIPELHRHFVPNATEAYLYDLLTLPRFRGLGIDVQSRVCVYDHLARLGVDTVYCYVRGDNPIGLRAAHKWQLAIARVWYLCFRGLEPAVAGLKKVPQVCRMS